MSSPTRERPQMRERSSSLSLAAPSVRVRRNRAPTVAMPALSTITSNQATPSAELPQSSPSSSPAVAVGATAPGGRRRRGTITERLFATDGYVEVGDDEDPATRRRTRSPSQGSLGSGRRAIEVVVPGEREASRRRGSMTSKEQADDEHHHEQEVELLDVLDQSVSTTSHLANIQAAFWPNALCRQPVVELQAPSPAEEKAEAGAEELSHEDLDLLEEDEEDPLGKHLAKVLKQEKRKEKFHAAMRGVWAFLKTPLGVCAAIYMILVVVWGGGLVLLLMIPMNSYIKKLWVEIASQILTGLFTLTSLLPLPWRMYDSCEIFVIVHYARVTNKRRRQRGLPPLRDPNDLPDPIDAEYWVGPGGEKMTGPRPAPIPSVKSQRKKARTDKHKHASDSAPDISPPKDGAVELAAMETKAGSSTEAFEEEVVLTDKEQWRLRLAQVRYSKSQTWYRAHTTPTHHAFPIRQAFYISLFMIGNSAFQAMLCGVMWGMDRFERPAWTTGCLIPLSFGCMIGASIMIWIYGERTKRKAEVSRKVWHMLKKDEEELEARRKAIIDQRLAEKEAKKHRHPTTSS